ncbi:MAG: hypothetical protein NT128_07330 [Proteobacteria bacterium]|nr:hypothetical protein [Pseudomonadota bacterium]
MNTTTKVVTRKNLVHRSRDNTDENNRQYLILSNLPKTDSNQARASVPTSTKILTEHINKHVWFVVAAVAA